MQSFMCGYMCANYANKKIILFKKKKKGGYHVGLPPFDSILGFEEIVRLFKIES